MDEKCFVCGRAASEAWGELWFRMLDAEGQVQVTVCPRQDARHVQIESDLRRPIQGKDRVVVMDAFMPGKPGERE